MTVERVAARCGVTRTVVYQQFGGLDWMLDALVERAGARAGAAIAGVGPPDEPPTLHDAMARVLSAVDADPATWRMFLVAPQVGPPALTESLARGRAVIRELSITALEHRGDPTPEDPELAARMLQVVADELVRLRLADPNVYTTERILAQMDAIGTALLRTRLAGR